MFKLWWWYIVAIAGFVGCHTAPTQPVPTDEPLAIRIVTTMPGNTEGLPTVAYTFRAEHPQRDGILEYLWDFDTAQVRTTASSVEYTFAHVGWYGVTVTVYRNHIAIGRGWLLVNIRGEPPQIRTVAIPAGSFLRGSTRVDFREQPVVVVRISTPLLMSAHEITQAEWEQVMGTGPAYYRGANLPVTDITWMDAVDFCNRLSIRLGLTPCYRIAGDAVECNWNANGYRLPTEAEWEYAARAATTTDTYAGNIAQPFAECTETDTLDPVLDRIAWYCKNSSMLPHPVGLKEPNQWGLYDMLGNVAEFVWDWSSGAQYSPGDTLDPRGPAQGMQRILRGGSFLDGARYCRAAARPFSAPPTRGKFYVGFRIVRLVH
ncbi:MAG: SUMF1/EgtB/PvdO family nonheme iron enzyme [Chlorobi bacterium]|nr:SUMF1/EgtB/PvdO family nonheme iron enzyme [Chlorobiota bacterium]